METPFGQTHYYFLGPKDGPKLVFVHGITAASPCYPQFFIELVDRGFHILTFDLFGRGFSDSPGVHYNEGIYVSQLFFLVHQLKWEKFHLIGLSLGGAIAASFATQFPQMIQSLMMIAPAGLLDSLPPIATILRFPLIGPVLWHSIGRLLVIRLSESNYIHSKSKESILKTIQMTAYQIRHHPGIMRAYYSTIEHFPVIGMDSTFAKLQTLLPNKTAVIWGKLDTVCPFYLHTKLTRLVPSIKSFISEIDGHLINVEHPKYCADCIKEFILENS